MLEWFKLDSNKLYIGTIKSKFLASSTVVSSIFAINSVNGA